jgi:hypothetical protein
VGRAIFRFASKNGENANWSCLLPQAKALDAATQERKAREARRR